MAFNIPSSLPLKKYGQDLPVCPYCAQKFYQGAESCPQCGYSFEQAQEKFGKNPYDLRRINDKAGCLKKTAREHLTKKLAKWEKKCPQLTLAVHIPLSIERQNIRQYALWALNSAQPKTADFERDISLSSTLLLILDINNKAVAFSYGYELNDFLSEDSLYPALSAGDLSLRDGLYEQAISLIMRQAFKILIKNIRQKSPSALSLSNLINHFLTKS